MTSTNLDLQKMGLTQLSLTSAIGINGGNACVDAFCAVNEAINPAQGAVVSFTVGLAMGIWDAL